MISESLQPSVSGRVLSASLAVALLGGFTLDARAQPEAISPPPSQPAGGDGGAIVLPQLQVQATGTGTPENTLRAGTGLSRLPGPIQSIPSQIDLITNETIQQQNATTLEQTLRNVPGITSSVGEGGGGVQGDQLRIRGFNAQNDIYVDGLRDFGTYTRDTFNYQDVMVLLGPAGVLFGPGSVGGVVNINTKLPQLGDRYSGNYSLGTGIVPRITADANYQIGPTSAVRLNLLGQNQTYLPGRDGQDGQRWGIAPSIAIGLGTPFTFTAEYMYYQYDQATDAGVPVLTPPGETIGRPATEFGLSRRNWYGVENDRDKSLVNRVTTKFKWDATDWLTLYNDTRVTYQKRYFAYTIISCTGTCLTDFFNRTGTPIYSVTGASAPYNADTLAMQNIASGQARFELASLRNEANFGVDYWFQNFERRGLMYDPSRPGGDLWSPNDQNNNYPTIPSIANNALRKTDNTSLGLFFVDRLWFTPQISAIGGFRWNRFTTDYNQDGPLTAPLAANNDSNFINPRAALVYEPTPAQSFYFSYATSATPPGSNFATLPGQATVNNSLLEPETNRIFEFGAKWSVTEDLGLTAALYRIVKSNAKETDPLTGAIISSGDEQRNQGIELGATGRVTPAWEVTARYTYMQSKILDSLVPATIGNRVQFVPNNALALWTTYDFYQGTRYNFTIGGGVTYRGEVFLNSANTQEAPANFSLDAMISHRFSDNVQLQVNAYNITNRVNYNTLFGNRVIPAAGTTVLAGINIAF